MSDQPIRAVFDCVIFGQAMINDRGPAAACLELARAGALKLLWSDYGIAEIRELPDKLPAKFLVTSERVEAFIEDISLFAEYVSPPPAVYQNPFDPDDSHYVDLAVAARALLIVSRDRHLLRLMKADEPAGADFTRRFPGIRIVAPEELLALVRTR